MHPSRLLPVVLSCLLCAPALASSPSPADPTARFPSTFAGKTHLQVEVVDAQGQPTTMKLKHGRPTLELDAKGDYGVRMTNLTDERIYVVMSVDGLDPMTGRKATRGQAGIVLRPRESRTLMGGKRKEQSRPGLVLPSSRTAAVAVIAYDEREDYPVQMRGVPHAPYSPEYFIDAGAGKKRWAPPADYPFRKASADPVESIYVQYHLQEPAGEQVHAHGSTPSAASAPASR